MTGISVFDWEGPHFDLKIVMGVMASPSRKLKSHLPMTVLLNDICCVDKDYCYYFDLQEPSLVGHVAAYRDHKPETCAIYSIYVPASNVLFYFT